MQQSGMLLWTLKLGVDHQMWKLAAPSRDKPEPKARVMAILALVKNIWVGLVHVDDEQQLTDVCDSCVLAKLDDDNRIVIEETRE